MEVSVSVYMLRDPESMEVRYVGVSQNPIKRFKDHLSFCYAIPVARWIWSLRDRGLKPVLDVRLSGLTREQAKRVELRLMRLHSEAYGRTSLVQRSPSKKSISLLAAFGTFDVLPSTKFASAS